MELPIILGVACVCVMVSSKELTVKSTDLQSCDEDLHVCVRDKEHCNSLRVLDTRTRTRVNLTCYFEMPDRVSCTGSPASRGSFLVFTWLREPGPCDELLWIGQEVNVTVVTEDVVSWSHPHTVRLDDVVRESQPVVVLSGSSSSSLVLSWTPSEEGFCQVRYAAEPGPQPTQEVKVNSSQRVNYTLQGLLPSTLYGVTARCNTSNHSWSLWSAEAKGLRTTETAPSTAPDVCYRLERRWVSPGAPPVLLLWLMWTELDIRQAGGRILGYQVRSICYSSTRERQPARATVDNVTGLTALLKVKGEYCRLTVAAFNSLGFGPLRTVNTEPHQPAVPSLRHLWAFSRFPDHMGFLVQWEMDAVPQAPPTASGAPANQAASSPAPPVSQFAVEWRTEGRDSVSSWTRVDNTLAIIQGDLDPEQIYIITVHPVHAPLCGPARSIPASLKHGALLEVVNLMAVEVTKTTVTVQWAWQRKRAAEWRDKDKVERYRLVLRFDSDDQALLLWPNQSEHTFQNLVPNREYSLLVWADNSITQEAIFTTTHFDALTAILVSSVILLAGTVFLCFLSRKVYKYYFVSMVSSPKRSSTGLWLMDKHQQASVRNILNIEDFRVNDVLSDKHAIKVAAGAQHHLEAAQYTNLCPAGLGCLLPSQEYVANVQMVAVTANGSVLLHSLNYISNSPVVMEALSEVQPLFLPPHHHRSNSFPQEEEVTSQFHTPEVFNLCFGKGLLDLPGGPPMFCESDYVLSSNFTETSPAESAWY